MKASSTKNRSWTSTAITAILAATVTTTAVTANACSRFVADTDHGTIVTRSLDWGGSRLGAYARVHPEGEARASSDVAEYANVKEWTVKYHTVAMEEHETFHGVTAEAINDQGLSAMGLYMNDSKPFVTEHKDSGAPAVNMADLTTFIAENYATVAEVVAGHEAGEFQIAWGSKMRGSDSYHGVHFSAVDKSGHIALFQLNEGGLEVVYTGDTDSDLRVMVNSPLQQDQREYAAQFDLANNPSGQGIPADIGSANRNVRMLWTSMNQDYSDLNYAETLGRIQQAFDYSVTVPLNIQDPQDNGAGDDYPTWVSFQYNLDNGDIRTRAMDTAQTITFNIEDTKAFDGPVCADLIQQANDGNGDVKWGTCNANS